MFEGKIYSFQEKVMIYGGTGGLFATNAVANMERLSQGRDITLKSTLAPLAINVGYFCIAKLMLGKRQQGDFDNSFFDSPYQQDAFEADPVLAAQASAFEAVARHNLTPREERTDEQIAYVQGLERRAAALATEANLSLVHRNSAELSNL